MKELIERHYQIHGRVQYVMFRDFATRKALSLGITGYVKNMTDGSVFAVAQGTAAQLSSYEGHLKEGPLLAEVKKIEKKDIPCGKVYETFSISYE